MTRPSPSNGSTGSPGQAALRRRALWWATVLCDRPDAPDPWALGDQDDEVAAAFLQEVASYLPVDQPDERSGALEVVLATGDGGLVVLLHQHRWSIAARAGGPLIVVSSDYPDGLLIQSEMPLDSQIDGERITAGTCGQDAASLIDVLIQWARYRNRGRNISHRF